MNTSSKTVFKHGSTTFYWSSMLFPRDKRAEVAILYAYVRTADDLVDAIPQQTKAFTLFVSETKKALAGQAVQYSIISDFIQLAQNYSFEHEWILAFLKAMEADTKVSVYSSYAELFEYMYGSAAVVGLMMCRLLGIPQSAYPAAIAQGNAMQLINFIRDISEDITLGRQYLPTQEIEKYQLGELSKQTARQHPKLFAEFIRSQIDKYRELQSQAQSGYSKIPYRYRVPIVTAAALYNWTASRIEAQPDIVFTKKLKPSKLRIILTGLFSGVKVA